MQYPSRINEAGIERLTTYYVYTLGLDIIIWIKICYYHILLLLLFILKFICDIFVVFYIHIWHIYEYSLHWIALFITLQPKLLL